jgi:hypothetical protein
MTMQSFFDFLVDKPDVANAIAAIGGAILAAFAVIISVISLVVAISSLWMQHKHNRLSVRPIANFDLGDYENHIYVKLQNNGFGPLIVNAIRVVGASNPDEALIKSMPVLSPKVLWANFLMESRGRSIQPGTELMLLELSLQDDFEQKQFALSRESVRQALGGLKLEAHYTDIYGTRLPVVTRDLSWFHRTLSEK